eukprot:4851491-Prymnesium_polylepis.1
MVVTRRVRAPRSVRHLLMPVLPSASRVREREIRARIVASRQRDAAPGECASERRRLQELLSADQASTGKGRSDVVELTFIAYRIPLML